MLIVVAVGIVSLSDREVLLFRKFSSASSLVVFGVRLAFRPNFPMGTISIDYLVNRTVPRSVAMSVFNIRDNLGTVGNSLAVSVIDRQVLAYWNGQLIGAALLQAAIEDEAGPIRIGSVNGTFNARCVECWFIFVSSLQEIEWMRSRCQ